MSGDWSVSSICGDWSVVTLVSMVSSDWSV